MTTNVWKAFIAPSAVGIAAALCHACGIGGGIFGAIRNYLMPVKPTPPEFQQAKKEIP